MKSPKKMELRFFLSSPDATREFVDAFNDAARDRAVNGCANALVVALHAYVDEFARMDELQRGVQASLGSDTAAVAQVLRDRELEVRQEILEIRREKKMLNDALIARQKEVKAILDPACRDLLKLPVEIEKLRMHIKLFEQVRQDCYQAYKNAGMSENEIESIGLKPSHADKAAWEAAITEHGARLLRIKAFIASAPKYYVDLLDVDAAAQ